MTPRPTVYGGATETYIRRAKYPYVYTLSIFVSQESKYGSTMVIYILTLQSKYIVIIKCDPIFTGILHHWKVQKYDLQETCKR